MGKRKYRAIYRDSSYKRSSSKAVRVAVSSCPVPRLVPYNKLMPFIKSVDISQLHSVRETLFHGLDGEEKVDGIYRDIQPLLLSLADFYLSQSRYELVFMFLLVGMEHHLEKMTLHLPVWSAFKI